LGPKNCHNDHFCADFLQMVKLMGIIGLSMACLKSFFYWKPFREYIVPY
jgi:hypothetical protein